MWRRDITQTGAKPLDTFEVSRFLLCQVFLASVCIFYQTKWWHIPQASNWRRHGSQHLQYNTLSLLSTSSFPECTPRWKHSCWLVSKALFLFMLHCVDIDTIIKNFFGYVLGFLAFCWATLLIVRTSVVARYIGGMRMKMEHRSTGKSIGPSANLPTTNPTRTALRSNLSLRGDFTHYIKFVLIKVTNFNFLRFVLN